MSNDQSTVRLVIGILGLLAFTVVIGCIVLVWSDKQMPDAMIAMGSVSVGAVAGILSKTGNGETQPVQVMNQAADPVLTEDV